MSYLPWILASGLVVASYMYYINKKRTAFVPTKVNLSNFLKGDPNSISQFQKSLYRNRFVVFNLEDDSDVGQSKLQHQILQYKKNVADFFGESEEYKNSLLQKEKDPLLQSRPVNKGYCSIKGVKEYLKLYQDSNESNLIPERPSELSSNFTLLFNQLKEVADKCLHAISTSKSNNDQNLFMTQKFYEDVLRLQRSSISVIRYLPTQKPIQDEPHEILTRQDLNELSTAQDSEKDKLKASEDQNVTYPSKTHIDTGILTMIICADVPGLQVWHSDLGKWLEVEKIYHPGTDLFVILGRKVPLFYHGGEQASPFKATTHRVALPLETERTSLLYFMDVTQ